jgi:hypothetical protein
MDMSPASIQAVSEQLPKAQIVFDHFHIVKLFNEKLSDLRRELFREAHDQELNDVLKGTRWLLLKNPEHLDPKRGEKKRLNKTPETECPLSHGILPQRRVAATPATAKLEGRSEVPDLLVRTRDGDLRIRLGLHHTRTLLLTRPTGRQTAFRLVQVPLSRRPSGASLLGRDHAKSPASDYAGCGGFIQMSCCSMLGAGW